MYAATAWAAARSSAARLGETPRIARGRRGPSARTATARSTEESTPPENATPRRAGRPIAVATFATAFHMDLPGASPYALGDGRGMVCSGVATAHASRSSLTCSLDVRNG